MIKKVISMLIAAGVLLTVVATADYSYATWNDGGITAAKPGKTPEPTPHEIKGSSGQSAPKQTAGQRQEPTFQPNPNLAHEKPEGVVKLGTFRTATGSRDIIIHYRDGSPIDIGKPIIFPPGTYIKSVDIDLPAGPGRETRMRRGSKGEGCTTRVVEFTTSGGCHVIGLACGNHWVEPPLLEGNCG